MNQEISTIEKQLQPFIMQSLFGVHEVHHFVRVAERNVPRITNFTDLAEAQSFAENIYCKLVLLRVQNYLNTLEFIRYKYPVAFHNIQPHIKNVTANIKCLQGFADLKKADLAYQLKETIIPQLNLCRGTRETKTSTSCTKLIDSLLPFVDKYIAPNKTIDFTKSHEFLEFQKISKT